MPYIIIFAVLALLAALVLYAVMPCAGSRQARAPFLNRNYAHRGLFTKNQQIPENSLPAFAAAAEVGYGIELDVQFTTDRRLIVFHDDTLDRMTGVHGWVKDFSYADICKMPLAGSGQHAPLFAEVLQTVAGRVPLIVEIKSRQEYSAAYIDALCRATLEHLQPYGGAYCIESFDPRVVRRIKQLAPQVLRGQLADSYAAYRKEGANPFYAYGISHCFCNLLGRPNFIAWCPARQNWALRLCKRLGAMMVYWTALPEDDAAALEQEYDAVIFQWYTPGTHYNK